MDNKYTDILFPRLINSHTGRPIFNRVVTKILTSMRLGSTFKVTQILCNKNGDC